MTTSKTKKSVPRAARAAKKTAKRMLEATDPSSMRYVVPAAAALTVGTGLVAGGFMMKKQIAGVVQTAITEASSIASHLGIGGLLELAGLQRRRSMWSTVLPGLGVLAAGALVGSAIVLWRSATVPRTAFESTARPGPHAASDAPNSVHESVGAIDHPAA